MKNITIFFLLISMSYTFYGQTKIKGFISDEIGPLPRANIIIKNTKTGTVSNMDGYYEIDAKVNDTLSISYLGYNTQDILVNSQKNINTLLKGDIALDEVEIIAYGSISCRTIYCGGVFRKITDNSKNFKSDLITQSLYPNPSKDGRFQLNLLDSYKNVEIEIINMSGQIIKTSQYQNTNQKIDIDLSRYASGMYIINIIADGKHLTAKKAIIG